MVFCCARNERNKQQKYNLRDLRIFAFKSGNGELFFWMQETRAPFDRFESQPK